MLNIPIYRAKKVDSDEYVIGYLIAKDKILEYCPAPTGMGTLQCVEDRHYFNIDLTTLAIHFPDMLTTQGNKIFASLSENGKGGDITKTKDGYNIYKRVHLFFEDGTRGSKDLEIIESLLKRYNSVLDLEVIGIKQ